MSYNRNKGRRDNNRGYDDRGGGGGGRGGRYNEISFLIAHFDFGYILHSRFPGNLVSKKKTKTNLTKRKAK